MAICKINYTDGHSENVPVTMRATCKAEEHGLKEGWGTAANSPIRFGLYSAYAAAACRASTSGSTPSQASTPSRSQNRRKPQTLRNSRMAGGLAGPAQLRAGPTVRRHPMAMAQRGQRP